MNRSIEVNILKAKYQIEIKNLTQNFKSTFCGKHEMVEIKNMLYKGSRTLLVFAVFGNLKLKNKMLKF